MAEYADLFFAGVQIHSNCKVVASKLNLAIWNLHLYEKFLEDTPGGPVDKFEAAVSVSLAIRQQFTKYRTLYMTERMRTRMLGQASGDSLYFFMIPLVYEDTP